MTSLATRHSTSAPMFDALRRMPAPSADPTSAAAAAIAEGTRRAMEQAFVAQERVQQVIANIARSARGTDEALRTLRDGRRLGAEMLDRIAASGQVEVMAEMGLAAQDMWLSADALLRAAADALVRANDRSLARWASLVGAEANVPLWDDPACIDSGETTAANAGPFAAWDVDVAPSCSGDGPNLAGWYDATEEVSPQAAWGAD